VLSLLYDGEIKMCIITFLGVPPFDASFEGKSPHPVTRNLLTKN